jgi:hypothetical protein
MALLWIEGFEGMGVTDNAAAAPTGVLGRKYTIGGATTATLVAGRFGGHGISMGNYLWDYFTTPTLPTTHATMVVGFAFSFSGYLAGGKIICLYDGATLGVNVRLAPRGELAVYSGNTLLAQTTGLAMVFNAWYFIELKVVCGASGSWELRVGGVTASSGSGNTKQGTHTYHNTVSCGTSSNVSCVRRYDDLYVLDGSGSINNDFLGNIKVVASYPSGDVTGAVNWTPSAAANHYTLVDENPANDNTDYVESSTSSQLDLYDYANLSGLSTVAGLQINTMAERTDANAFSLLSVIKSAGTQDDGSAVAATAAYSTIVRVSESDPHASAPWTQTSINAAQFGVKVA